MDVQDLEAIEGRLDNVRSIEPILSALRTISAGGWHSALNRMKKARLYAEHLRQATELLLSASPDVATIPWDRPSSSNRRIGVLVIGGNHGLCGDFNDLVISAGQSFIDDSREGDQEVSLFALGQRIQRHFERRREKPAWSEPLSSLTGPSFRQVRDLVREALQTYESGQWDAFHVVHNAYRGASVYSPQVERVIPPERFPSSSSHELWPPTIVEGDPDRLYSLLRRQWITLRVYQVALQSSAAEQSARFRLLEGASQNVNRLIDELTQVYHTARQREITMEMLDLLGASGMLSSEELE